MGFYSHPGFCDKCVGETDDVYASNNFQLNGIGTDFFGTSQICDTCHSAIRAKYFTFLWIPLLSLGRYRVLNPGKGKYVGRRIRH